MKRRILVLLIIGYICEFTFTQSDIALLNINNESEGFNTDNTISKLSHSFDLINGMMVIDATVNGEVGKFILDTGAPGIILNDIPTKISDDYIAGGLAGQVEIEEVAISDFRWESIELTNLHGFNIDMSHLEASLDIPINGLIGFGVLQNYELFIDFDAKLIELLDAKKSYFDKRSDLFVVIPFELEGHLPIIQVKVGGEKLRFGIDTGASVNVINADLRTVLGNGSIQAIRTEEMRGLDQQIIQYESAIIDNIALKREALTSMRYLFTDLSHINQGAAIPIDGLLGAQFFQHYKIAINYKKQKIFIAPK